MASGEVAYLRKIEGYLDEAKWDLLGHHAGVVAAGVDGSVAATSLRELPTRLSEIAAVSDGHLKEIVWAISGLEPILNGIQDALRNPSRTAGTEMLSRGLTALRKGWIPEAIADLSKSIQIYPYDPGMHVGLGCALVLGEQPAAAAASFDAATRYSLQDQPDVACGAALMAAKAWEDGGEPDRATSSLQVANAIPNCPEIAFALALRTNDPRYTEHALRIGPDLAVAAAALSLVGTEEVVRNVYKGPSGLESRFIELRRRVHSVGESFKQNAVILPQGLPQPPTFSGRPEQEMAAVGRWLRDAGHQLSTAAASARRALSMAADQAQRAADSARVSATNLDPKVEGLSRSRSGALVWTAVWVALAVCVLWVWHWIPSVIVALFALSCAHSFQGADRLLKAAQRERDEHRQAASAGTSRRVELNRLSQRMADDLKVLERASDILPRRTTPFLDQAIARGPAPVGNP